MGNLILERSAGESLLIQVDGREIEVTIVKTSEAKTKLSIQADKEVLILRSEIKPQYPL